ncbi:MAG: Spy/CpxP family protein refolding chaperone [Acidobacteriia bacterium]|nr:Spy/CpxP family protein refolding chaperone [Terriglobia bacterium]
MKNSLVIAALAGALALAALAPAIAQQRSGWLQKRRAGLFVQHIVNDLNLTTDQRAQIKAILQRERPAIVAIMQKSEEQNAQLRARGSLDEAFVRSIAQQEAGTMAEGIVEREQVRAQILAMLTPEQQRKFNQLAAELRSAVQDRIANLGDQL